MFQGTGRLSSALMAASRAEMALSRAEMDFSKAEISVGGFEAVWSKWAKITIALFVLVMAYGIWIVIVAGRDQYVHKKFVKSQNKDLQLPLYCLLLGSKETV